MKFMQRMHAFILKLDIKKGGDRCWPSYFQFCTQPCCICPTSSSSRNKPIFGSDLVPGTSLSSWFGRDFPVGSPESLVKTLVGYWVFWISDPVESLYQTTGTILLEATVSIQKKVCFLEFKFCKLISKKFQSPPDSLGVDWAAIADRLWYSIYKKL